MSIARKQLRSQARSDYRANEIVEGKCKVGKTKSLRTALAGNNPSIGKRAFQAQKKYGKMIKHARLVSALLVRAAGGEAETALQQVRLVPAYQDRIARMGTTITRRNDLVAKSSKPGKSHKGVESRHQRIARKGKVERANKETLRALMAGEYGAAGKPRAEAV